MSILIETMDVLSPGSVPSSEIRMWTVRFPLYPFATWVRVCGFGSSSSSSCSLLWLVFKAHRLVYHSTLSLRVIKKKKGFGFDREAERGAFSDPLRAERDRKLREQSFGVEPEEGSYLRLIDLRLIDKPERRFFFFFFTLKPRFE